MEAEGNDGMEANRMAVDDPILGGEKHVKGLGVMCASTRWEGTIHAVGRIVVSE